MIVSNQGLLVTHIDKNYCLTRFTLSQIMAQMLRPAPADPDTAKFQQRLVDKVKYIKEVLISIHTASANANANTSKGEDAQAQAPAPAPAPGPAPARAPVPAQMKVPERKQRERERAPLPLNSRASKMSLR